MFKINLTQSAAQKIREAALEEDERGIDNLYLRAKVCGGGCAGFTYDLSLTSLPPSDTDENFVSENVRVIVDPLSAQYLDGVTIDYIEGKMQSGFKFNNPNSTGSCGCGSSFSA